jgi:hypothetical protein
MAQTFAIDRVGVIVTICNDIELIPKFYRSLVQSMPINYSYGLVAIDGGSFDGSVEAMNTCEVKGPYPDLSVALNVGIRTYLPASKESLLAHYGSLPSSSEGFDYVCWIHPDMLFPMEGWLPKMVDYLKQNPKCGKLSPEDAKFKDHPDFNGLTTHPGNGCPWVMPVRVLRAIEQDHKWFDEGFTGIGGMEDWDINKRVLDAGYTVDILHPVYVEHEGMGTRKKKNTNADAVANRSYYQRKWGNGNCPV